MLSVLFSDDELYELFDEGVPLNVTELEAEARRRAQPGGLEELELEGVFHGGYRIKAGRLIFIQPGLVLFIGDGSSDHPSGSYHQLQELSGIGRDPEVGYAFAVERFVGNSFAATLRLCSMSSLGVSWPHLDGRPGCLVLNNGWGMDEMLYVGFDQELWDRIVSLLDKYLVT